MCYICNSGVTVCTKGVGDVTSCEFMALFAGDTTRARAGAHADAIPFRRSPGISFEQSCVMLTPLIGYGRGKVRQAARPGAASLAKFVLPNTNTNTHFCVFMLRGHPSRPRFSVSGKDENKENDLPRSSLPNAEARSALAIHRVFAHRELISQVPAAWPAVIELPPSPV